MKLEKDNYTKEEVAEMLKSFEKQITDLNAKLEESNKAVEKVKELEQSNLTNAIKLEMVKAGLSEDLFDLVSADSVENAKSKIDKLVELQKADKIDNSYKPESRKNDDVYAKAEQKGDVKTMLTTKLSQLFN